MTNDIAESLRDRIAIATQRARDLDRETDTLKASIQEFEKWLIDAKFGVAATVDFGVNTKEGMAAGCEYLGFKKEGNDWRLVYIRVTKGATHGYQSPLDASNRDVRVRAVALFSALLDQILVNINDLMVDTEGAIDSVDDFLETLKVVTTPRSTL